MKVLFKKMMKLLIIPLCFSLFGCSGEVGYSTTDPRTIDGPTVQYRLIDNDTAYEVIGIEENYLGYFMIDISHSDPSNGLGELPVLGIADDAFVDQKSVFFIFIAANVINIGKNVFQNWKPFQQIYFQITEKQVTNLFYEFDEEWNKDCEATINWGTSPEQFGISASDYPFSSEINSLSNAQYELSEVDMTYTLTSISDYYTGLYSVPRVYESPLNQYGELPVTAISPYALLNSRAEYICIPDTVISIGAFAFAQTSENQKILFQISEEEASKYDFDIDWNTGCFAKIYWDLGDLFIF